MGTGFTSPQEKKMGLTPRPGGNPGANLKSISHRCHLILVASVRELTKTSMNLPLGCLQSGLSPAPPHRTRLCFLGSCPIPPPRTRSADSSTGKASRAILYSPNRSKFRVWASRVMVQCTGRGGVGFGLRRFCVETPVIYKLGFNQNYYTFALSLLLKIFLCRRSR